MLEQDRFVRSEWPLHSLSPLPLLLRMFTQLLSHPHYRNISGGWLCQSQDGYTNGLRLLLKQAKTLG